jgi:hypothetical protein
VAASAIQLAAVDRRNDPVGDAFFNAALHPLTI